MTEYELRHYYKGTLCSTHGPYDTLDNALRQKDAEERLGFENWALFERDVTEWTPVPSTPPDSPKAA